MERKIYIVRDENGKAWLDEADFNRDNLIRRFVMNWLCRCPNIGTYEARQVWNVFEKNGWKIEELKTFVAEPTDG